MNIKICPKCGGKVSKTLKECPHCGHYFKKTKKCPDCEEQIEFDLDICPICGHIFNKKKKEVKQEEPLEDDNDIVEETESIEDDELKEEKIVKPTKIINNEDLLTHSSKCPYCGSNTQIDLGDGIFECLICHNTIVSKPIHKNKIIESKTLNVEQKASIETKKDLINSISVNDENTIKKSNEINNKCNGLLPKKHIIRSIFIWLVLALDVTYNIVALILALASPSTLLPILDIVFSICVIFAIILAIMQIVIHSKEKKLCVKRAQHNARLIFIVLVSICGFIPYLSLRHLRIVNFFVFITCIINFLLIVILVVMQIAIHSKEHHQPSNGNKKKKRIIAITSLLIVTAITATLLAIFIPRCANKYSVYLYNSIGGTVTGSGSYAAGSSVTIRATPDTGYTFDGWYTFKTGSKVTSSNPYTFTMPANNVSYIAKFYNKNAWFLKSDWWNYCSNGVTGQQATASDIGKEVDLIVNSQFHKVRLIDVDHDELNDGSGNKAHCTFEFINLLSDSDGYSLATLWDTSNGSSSTNYNYLDSDLRYALDGKGGGKDRLRWYQKGSGKKSTDPNYTKPVIEMLPEGLQNKLQTVKKQVATTSSYDVTSYDAKVFALTHNEMTKNSSSYSKAEGSTYQYYKDHDDNASHIKHQIKWHDGAVIGYKEIDDLSWHPRNYAGYNSSTDSYGGIYWLASPYADYSHIAWSVYGDGILSSNDVCCDAFAVAPAFCI